MTFIHKSPKEAKLTGGSHFPSVQKFVAKCAVVTICHTNGQCSILHWGDFCCPVWEPVKLGRDIQVGKA